MSTPNSAGDAQPGDRFTDPDGGTWVRRHMDYVIPWSVFDAYGMPHERTQEEAEKANLVPLVAETEVKQARRERDEALAEMRAERTVPPEQGESRTDADRADDAELFLAQWPGEQRLTAEDRGDFLVGWVGWHAGVDFAHECDVRDQLAAASNLARVATIKELDALPDSAVVVDANDFAWQRNGRIDCALMWDQVGESGRWESSRISLPAVVVWTPASSTPAPLDPGNPEGLPEFDEKNSAHLRWLADAIGDVTLPWASDEENHPDREQANDEMAETVEQFADFWRSEADRLDREHAEAEQDAEEAAFVEGIYERWCDSEGTDHDLIRETLRAERARASAEEAGQ